MGDFLMESGERTKGRKDTGRKFQDGLTTRADEGIAVKGLFDEGSPGDGDFGGDWRFTGEQCCDDGEEFGFDSGGKEAVIANGSEVVVGDMSNESGDEVGDGEGHGFGGFGIMVEIVIGDGSAVIMGDSGFPDGRTFEIFTKVVDGKFMIVGLLVKMDDPGLAVEVGHPRAEGGMGFDMFQVRRHFQGAVFGGGLQEGDELIFPEFFEGDVLEVAVFPSRAVRRETTGSSREMEMDIEFQVSAEGMERQIDAGQKALLFGQRDNEVRRDSGYFIQELSIDGEEVPEFLGHGESDMLPGSVGQSIPGGFNPVVGGFFTTGGTESGLAGMGDFFGGEARGAGEEMKAKKSGSADEELEDVGDNADSDQVSMFEEQFPPVAVIQEYASEFYSGYEFHRNKNIQPTKISKKKLPLFAA
jgi:hypothetical protein